MISSEPRTWTLGPVSAKTYGRQYRGRSLTVSPLSSPPPLMLINHPKCRSARLVVIRALPCSGASTAWSRVHRSTIASIRDDQNFGGQRRAYREEQGTPTQRGYRGDDGPRMEQRLYRDSGSSRALQRG